MTERDLTLEKISLLMAMIPRLCSQFHASEPCHLCQGECPTDLAMRRLSDYRREYTAKNLVRTGHQGGIRD